MRIDCEGGKFAPEYAAFRQLSTLRLTILAVTLMTALSGCAGTSSTVDSKWGVSSSARIVASGPVPKGGGQYKLGKPYQVAGRWYVPRHEPYYDRTGTGSWYGSDFHGRKTANGELFDMDALTAAHPTLPLPSYAYVTNLRNGRTILVRINDRGPYVANREIDLSRASAKALGYAGAGLGQVRVRWAGNAPLNGDDSREQAFLRNQPWNGGSPNQVAARMPAPPRYEQAPPQRYAQDMRRRSDAEDQPAYGRYDQRRDDQTQYRDARYDRQPQGEDFESQFSQDRPAARQDYAASQRPRADSDDESQPAPRRSDPYEYQQMRRDPAPPPQREPETPVAQMWSPFDHREQQGTPARR